jgi:hypothetical protein
MNNTKAVAVRIHAVLAAFNPVSAIAGVLANDSNNQSKRGLSGMGCLLW